LTYVPELIGREGLLVSAMLLILPFCALWVLTTLFSPWVPHRVDGVSEAH
jgi:hypothetical protein